MPISRYCKNTEHDFQIVDVAKLQVAPNQNRNGEYDDTEIRVVAFCKKCGKISQNSEIITKKLILGK